MRIAAVCLVLASSFGWASQKSVKADKMAEKLVVYCQEETPKIDPDYLRYVTGETKRLVHLAKVHDKRLKDLDEHRTVEVLLAAFYVESRYDQFAVGDGGHSYGISQVRRRHIKRLLCYWKDLGVVIEGSINDPTTQVAFGVAEFADCFYWARNSAKDMRYWDAIRRYNGSGWQARRHANRVFTRKNEIFRRG